MNWIKNILVGLGVSCVFLQFIQPERVSQKIATKGDFLASSSISDSAKQLIRASCYNCHSMNTEYPWYSYVQPVGWFLSYHIDHGREELNLSYFDTLSARRQASKLKNMANQIKDGAMPLSSYTLIHKEARLSSSEKTSLVKELFAEADKKLDDGY